MTITSELILYFLSSKNGVFSMLFYMTRTAAVKVLHIIADVAKVS